MCHQLIAIIYSDEVLDNIDCLIKEEKYPEYIITLNNSANFEINKTLRLILGIFI